jgi:RNA ligase
MTKRVAPYKHADGSDCWTKQCSRNTLKDVIDVPNKNEFIQEWFSPVDRDKTFIDSIAPQSEFDKAVANNEVNRQRHPLYPYSIYKYSAETVWRKNWNTVTMASRGLIVNDETGEILARPFAKFFNYNEPSVPFELMKGNITVSEKLDGSLGILLNTPDGVRINTAGGFQAPQSDHATKIYHERYEGKWKPRKNVTYMWEIIYPENRIVVDYDGEDDIHLLGAVDIKTGKSIPLAELKEWKWKRAREYSDFKSLDSVVTSSERENHEGFIVHFTETDVRVKYKHEEYLNHHRYATGINSRRIWEKLRDGEDMEEWIKNAPEEFEDYITTTRTTVQNSYDAKLNEIYTGYNDFMKTIPNGLTQKEFAHEVTTRAPKELVSYIFALKNNGRLSEVAIKGIWEKIKPEAEASFWSMNNGKENN